MKEGLIQLRVNLFTNSDKLGRLRIVDIFFNALKRPSLHKSVNSPRIFIGSLKGKGNLSNGFEFQVSLTDI
jgi:hypothetical protein